jgi:hypothetical protein
MSTELRANVSRKEGTPCGQATGSGVSPDALPGQARWQGVRRSWVLLGSGLGTAERESLEGFAALCGARVASRWQPSVTHVVCGLDGSHRAK